MTQVDTPTVYSVDIIESERGWGCRLEDTLYFNNAQSAQAYVAEYNRKHNPVTESRFSVPDWYMYALLQQTTQIDKDLLWITKKYSNATATVQNT